MRLFGAGDVGRGCPPELELSRAISLGPTAALSAHLAACARCAALSRTLARAREAARELPWRAPNREQVRTALLASLAAERATARPPTRSTRRWLVLAAPIAVAAGLVVAWRLAPRPAAPVAETAAAPPPADTPVAVPPAPTEALPNASASAPATRARTDVRGTSIRTKVAGDRRESEAAPSPAELAFVEGWAAFRAGRFGGAINAFDDVLRLDPTGQLAEDARYWRAVALARTTAPNAAAELDAFLRRYPRSAHAADATALRASLAPRQP